MVVRVEITVGGVEVDRAPHFNGAKLQGAQVDVGKVAPDCVLAAGAVVPSRCTGYEQRTTKNSVLPKLLAFSGKLEVRLPLCTELTAGGGHKVRGHVCGRGSQQLQLHRCTATPRGVWRQIDTLHHSDMQGDICSLQPSAWYVLGQAHGKVSGRGCGHSGGRRLRRGRELRLLLTKFHLLHLLVHALGLLCRVCCRSARVEGHH